MLLLSGALLLAVNYLLVRAALPPAGAENSPTTTSVTVGAHQEISDTPDAPSDSAPQAQVQQLNIAEYRSNVLNTLLLQSGVTLLITAAIALVLGRIAANRMLRPVHRVAATARRLSADNLDQRIRMQGPRDELTELADTFDEMLDRLADSFDSQRRFVANASHELRTPLATQRTIAEVAMARPNAGEAVRAVCERLLAMNSRSEALIDGLLVLAGSDRGLESKVDVQLDELAERVLSAHRTSARRMGVELRFSARPCPVRGEPVLLDRLLNNLIDNAVKYNDRGTVWVRVGGEAALEVSNTGPEVPADAVPSLLEPFVRLPRERVGADQGAGLGLSIVASIARAHGGSVVVRPRAGGGLVVTITLPPG
ncbi:sensor histidine kinase [Amycolatopsis anabasis]|uniref:sensor histidine kinase n=1 Tax=Amycolatopsis anabasis TaxID=1840409 RepID=UPI0015D17A59|nr:ATP-binding protein [Amycolatopsis anabasis]